MKLAIYEDAIQHQGVQVHIEHSRNIIELDDGSLMLLDFGTTSHGTPTAEWGTWFSVYVARQRPDRVVMAMPALRHVVRTYFGDIGKDRQKELVATALWHAVHRGIQTALKNYEARRYLDPAAQAAKTASFEFRFDQMEQMLTILGQMRHPRTARPAQSPRRTRQTGAPDPASRRIP